MKKLYWNDIEEIADSLANKIIMNGFKPDYIIGITTGGLIPLYFLTKKLKIKNILTISAKSYNKDKQEKVEITYLPEIDLKNKKILLVDEVAETGSSLRSVFEVVINKYQPMEIKTATLAINKEKCKFYPDFYVVEESEWVIFPWEKDDFPEYFLKN